MCVDSSLTSIKKYRCLKASYLHLKWIKLFTLEFSSESGGEQVFFFNLENKKLPCDLLHITNEEP